MALIEDHALIGDGYTAALVCRDGSIDWLCLPRFDSPACFAALLGTPDNGMWRIAPAAEVTAVTRQYRGDTMVLETVFETEGGAVALIDFMRRTTLVRIVEGRRGTVQCRLEFAPRFEYGSIKPTLRAVDRGISALSDGCRLELGADTPLTIQSDSVVADFTVHLDQRVRFSLSDPTCEDPPPDLDTALRETEQQWQAWSDRSKHRGRWQAQVRRSCLTLKALCHIPTGAVVAAPTTSLPEWIGGVRNWDYRYCWPRDSSLALLALATAGYTTEFANWTDWMHRAVGHGPPRPLYNISGEVLGPELELPDLSGYEGSRPVRIGNAAMDQYQLDVYGEIELAWHRCLELGAVAPDRHWDLRVALISDMEAVWREPDEGIWEVRGGRQHFTYSKAMAWAAVDRAIRSAEAHALPAPLERWRELRSEIFQTVCDRGFNSSRGAFTQTLDGDILDASLLLLPLIGFLPPTDDRIVATTKAIGKELMVGGLIRRYNTHETADGLPVGEGVFLACSFWYASNLALQGRTDEAEALFERLHDLCNDVGLLSEEYDPVAHRQLGNFPQGFSHSSLIWTAVVLDGDVTSW